MQDGDRSKDASNSANTGNNDDTSRPFFPSSRRSSFAARRRFFEASVLDDEDDPDTSGAATSRDEFVSDERVRDLLVEIDSPAGRITTPSISSSGEQSMSAAVRTKETLKTSNVSGLKSDDLLVEKKADTILDSLGKQHLRQLKLQREYSLDYAKVRKMPCTVTDGMT